MDLKGKLWMAVIPNKKEEGEITLHNNLLHHRNSMLHHQNISAHRSMM